MVMVKKIVSTYDTNRMECGVIKLNSSLSKINLTCVKIKKISGESKNCFKKKLNSDYFILSIA